MTREEIEDEVRSALLDATVAEIEQDESTFCQTLVEEDIQQITDSAMEFQAYGDADPVYSAFFSYWAAHSGEYSI